MATTPKKQRGTPSKKKARKPVWVAVSGGFDPLHIGHVRMMEKARTLGDKLVVIINNDNWLHNKKGFAFMPQKERKELIESFPFVDRVVFTDHKPSDPDRSVSRTLRKIRPHIFANGGDRTTKDAGNKNSPLNADQQACKDLNIKMVYGVGKGGKVQSSSWMIRDAARAFVRSVRPWGKFYNWDTGKGWHLKTLYVKPGKRLSLQYHHHRSECWVLVEGDATAIAGTDPNDLREVPLEIGKLHIIDLKMIHRLTSKKGGTVVEVSLGKFDENDIVRIDDDFGRTA